MILNTNKHLYNPKSSEKNLFKNDKGSLMTRPLSQSFRGYRGDFYNVISQNSFEYDFEETNRIIDTESFVAKIFKRKKDLIKKEDPIIKSDDAQNLKYIQKKLSEILYSSKIDLDGLIDKAAESLVSYHNLFILAMREEEVVNKSKLPPIKSLHVLSPLRLKPATDEIGETVGYYYRPLNNAYKSIYIPAENIFHLHVDKKLDCSIGTPPLESVKDDILSLRQIEESMERLIYKNASPLLHAKVGTKDHPADLLPNGQMEIDYYNSLISNMDEEGGLTTSHRVDIEILGTESKALRFDGAMDYFKSRVLSGLSASMLDLGEAPASLSSAGAEMISQTLKEDVISYQKVLERFFTNVLFEDVLLDSYRYSGKLNIPKEGKVTLKLPDPNIESKIRHESHLANLVRNNLMSREQFSNETGYELPPEEFREPAEEPKKSGEFSAKSTPQNQNTDSLETEYQVLDELLSKDRILYRDIYIYLVEYFESLDNYKPLELIAKELESLLVRYKELGYPVKILAKIFNQSVANTIVKSMKDI